MLQDPNPTDYPHLESFMDWLYANVESLPPTTQELIRIMEAPAKARKAWQKAFRSKRATSHLNNKAKPTDTP